MARTIAITDACGSYFGRQGGEVRIYQFDRPGDYEALLADGRSEDPEWLSDEVRERAEHVDTIKPNFIVPV